MEPLKGKCASSQVYLAYTELFCVPEVTAVFLSSCDSFLGDSRVPSSTLRILTCLIGNTELLCTQCRGQASSPAKGDVSWDFSNCSRNLGYILE